MDPHAVGFQLADLGVVVPSGGSPEFLPAMRRLCSDEQVDVVVSVVDEELEPLCELEAAGVKVVQPERAFIRLALDKLGLMRQFSESGLPAPRTELATEIDLEKLIYPVIIKPRVGRGSRGILIARDEHSLTAGLAASLYPRDELIVQKLVVGPEYTVSVVLWRDGEVQAVVPKEIIDKRGVTRAAVTRKNEKIDSYCRDIQRCFGANGPFNVQLCVDRSDGTPYAFEINPRFSTSITLTMAAGVNELTGLITQALEGRESWKFGPWREGRIMTRRTLDLFSDETEYRAREIRDLRT